MKKHLATFVYAILAGICIGLGGTVFLRVKDLFAGANIVGALLFSIGLFAICTRGYNLFTGKACYLFDNKPSYLITLAVIWVGNLVGTSLLALVENLTAICGSEAGINITAKAMVEGKMATSLGSVFLLACICNILISVSLFLESSLSIWRSTATPRIPMSWENIWPFFWGSPSLSSAVRSTPLRICTTGRCPGCCLPCPGRAFCTWW